MSGRQAEELEQAAISVRQDRDHARGRRGWAVYESSAITILADKYLDGIRTRDCGGRAARRGKTTCSRPNMTEAC